MGFSMKEEINRFFKSRSTGSRFEFPMTSGKIDPLPADDSPGKSDAFSKEFFKEETCGAVLKGCEAICGCMDKFCPKTFLLEFHFFNFHIISRDATPG